MATQKFYNVVLLVEALIQAHADGKPMNPAGIRGHGMLFTYQETDKAYNGKDVVLGDRIMSTNLQEFANAINKSLEAGLTVLPNTASAIGIIHSVRLEGDINVSKIKVQAENAEVQGDVSTDEAGDQDILSKTGHQGSDTTQEVEESSEDVDKGDDEEGVPEEVQESDEVESDVEPESGSEGAGDEETDNSNPDWDHAESLLGSSKNKTEAKKKLEAYAREFGIELDRNKKFEDMMVDFKSEVNYGEGEA